MFHGPFPDLKSKYVAHFTSLDEDSAHLYHNVELRLHPVIGGAALFARFAYSIFELAGRGPKASSRATLYAAACHFVEDKFQIRTNLHSLSCELNETTQKE